MRKNTLAMTVSIFIALAFAGPVWAGYPKTNLGVYVFIGGAKQKKALQKAIKSVSSKVGFFLRGRVQKALKKTFSIKKKLTFKMNNKELTIQAHGKKSLASRVDGKPKIFRSKKGSVSLTRSFAGNTLTEKLQPKGKKGYRHHSYTFSKDGKKMTLRTTAYLARLKKKISYTLTYTKQQPK